MQSFEKPSVLFPDGRWVTQGGVTSLSTGVSFGFGPVATPPTGTQGVIGQAPVCVDEVGAVIPNTACITFNSRGVPVDNWLPFAPTQADAVYVTDASVVYGVTVAATGLLRMWRTPRAATPAWMRN